MINNRKAAVLKHNASKKRHADIYVGCLKAGNLKQVHKKVKALKIGK